jgi:hypothetical protein
MQGLFQDERCSDSEVDDVAMLEPCRMNLQGIAHIISHSDKVNVRGDREHIYLVARRLIVR